MPDTDKRLVDALITRTTNDTLQWEYKGSKGYQCEEYLPELESMLTLRLRVIGSGDALLDVLTESNASIATIWGVEGLSRAVYAQADRRRKEERERDGRILDLLRQRMEEQ